MVDRDSTPDTPIRAVAYLRKSTAGQRADGKEKQEESIPKQTAKVAELKSVDGAAYTIVRTYADPGKSGWKRGAARPDFTRMLRDCQQHRDVQAILVYDLDRFSRATVGEVWSDIQALHSAGVRWIHSVNEGVFDLGNASNIGEILTLTVKIWSNNEFSRKQSNHSVTARSRKAEKGLMSGGKAPYAMESDGAGGLVHGDPDAVATVRQIFAWFADQCESVQWVAKELNRIGTPAPKGGRWHPRTVAKILKHRAYVGDFTFGESATGRFHQLDENGKIVASNGERRQNEKPVFEKFNRYEPIIDRAVFDKAQQRFASFKKGRRPRHGGFCCSGGVLYCGHCQQPLVPQTKNGGSIYYRCLTTLRQGAGACGLYSIPEYVVLPMIFRLLDQEIDALVAESLTPKMFGEAPKIDHAKEIAKFQERIDRAEPTLFDIKNLRRRQTVEKQIEGYYNEIDRLTAEMNAPANAESDAAQAKQVAEWWDETKKTLVESPIPAAGTIAKTNYPNTSAYIAAWGDDSFVAGLNRRTVNECLHNVGCRLEIRWTTEQKKTRKRYHPAEYRLRLGQRSELGTFGTHGSAWAWHQWMGLSTWQAAGIMIPGRRKASDPATHF